MTKKVFIYLPSAEERKTLSLVLFDAGITPLATDDPAIARDLVEENFFDLIICPFEEDKNNPFHFIEEVVRKKHPFTPVFLFAPKLKLDLITRAIRLGVRDIFNFPIDYPEILNSVLQQLGGNETKKKAAADPRKALSSLISRIRKVLPEEGDGQGSSAPSDWEDKLNSLEQEKEALESKLANASQSESKVASLEKKIADLSRERDELTAEFEKKLESTSSKWVEMEKQLLEREEKLNAELKMLEGQKDGSETGEETKKWMEKCMVLEEQNHKLRAGTDDLKEEVVSLKARVSQSSGSQDEGLQEELEKLKATFAAREKELQKALEQKVALLETRDDASSTSTAQLDLSAVGAPELDDLGDDLEKIREAYLKMKASLEAQEKETQRLMATLEERENDLEEAKLLMNEREAYVEECENTMMQKSMELHEREIEMEQMKDEVFKEKARLAALAENGGDGDSSSLDEIESLKSALEKEKQALNDSRRKFEAEQEKWRQEREAEIKAAKEAESQADSDGDNAGDETKKDGKSLEDWKRLQRRSKLLRSW